MSWEDTADECIRKLDEAIKHINAINKILVDTANEYQAEIKSVIVNEAESIANGR